MTANATDNKRIDELFDDGADMTDFIVDSETRFPGQNDSARKINISMPEWMIRELDKTAKHLAVTRQAVINMWIGERLAKERESAL